jgi:hypothetical protein
MIFGLAAGWSSMSVRRAVAVLALIGAGGAPGCSVKEREYGEAEGGNGGDGGTSGTAAGPSGQAGSESGLAGNGMSGGGTTNTETGAAGDAGAAGNGPGQVCEPHARRCSDSGIPQECDEQGSAFVDLEPCAGDTPLCDTEAGACVGPCTPDDQRCTSDQIIQECDQQGTWQAKEQCGFACLDETGTPTCGGSCKPGERTCGANQTPYLCDDTGTPQAQAACTNVCTGAGQCTGDCPPTSTRCSQTTAGAEETCTAEGTWGTAVACTFVCDANAGKCGGECKPGMAKQCSGKKVQACQANGTWMDETDCGTVPCTQGACKACTPQAKQCNAGKPQTCSAGGDWVDDQANVCPFVCDTASGTCAGECVPNTDACVSGTSKHCGSDGKYNTGTVCPYVCVAGTGKCGGECVPNTKHCTGSTSQTCSAAGAWGSDMACQYGCNTGNGTCNACTDEPLATTCAGNKCGSLLNNCGKQVTCTYQCSDNKYCTGTETCVNNQCQNGTPPCTTVADATNCVGTCTEGTSAAVCGVTGKDADSDGHKTDKCASGPRDDCDDTKATVFVGNTESCDGIDNNCTGGIDEGTMIPTGNPVFDVGDVNSDLREPAIASDGTNYGILFENSSNNQLYLTVFNPARQTLLPVVGVANATTTTHGLAFGSGLWGFAWYEPGFGISFSTMSTDGTQGGIIRVQDDGPYGHGRVAYMGGSWGLGYMDFNNQARVAGRTVTGISLGAKQLLVNFPSTQLTLISTGSRYVAATDGGNVSVLNNTMSSATALPGTVNAVIGTGSNGFAVLVKSASGSTWDFYVYSAVGVLSCGPTAIGDANFVPDAVAGNSNGYLVVSSAGGNVRAIKVDNSCKYIQTWPVYSGSAAITARVAASTSAGYGITWEIPDSVSARIVNANICN